MLQPYKHSSTEGVAKIAGCGAAGALSSQCS